MMVEFQNRHEGIFTSDRREKPNKSTAIQKKWQKTLRFSHK
jgi:hypothetical protein